MTEALTDIWLKGQYAFNFDTPSLLASIDSSQESSRASCSIPDIDDDLNVSSLEASSASSLSLEIPFFATPVSYTDVHKPYKTACLSVVQECISELTIMINILQHTAGNLKVTPVHYKPLSERFGFLSSFSSFIVGGVYTDPHKIQKHLKETVMVLENLKEEEDIFSKETCVYTFLQSCKKMSEEESILFIDCESKRKIFNKLQKKIRDFRKNSTKFFEALDSTMDAISGELKDFMEHERATMRYIMDWEISRQEQNFIYLKRKEGKYGKTIIKNEEKCRNEEIIHENMKKFCEESKNDFEQDIENWMEKYDKEMEEMELKIYDIQSNTYKTTEQKELLQKEYDRRTRAIEDWLEYKRIKKERDDRLALENEAAVKIQAWWKGTMVRKKLGPYRRKGKKGKKGNTKDKKKGK